MFREGNLILISKSHTDYINSYGQNLLKIKKMSEQFILDTDELIYPFYSRFEKEYYIYISYYIRINDAVKNMYFQSIVSTMQFENFWKYTKTK